MNYYICVPFIDRQRLAIPTKYGDELRRCHEELSSLIEIESLFSVYCRSHLELEKELLIIGVDDFLSSKHDVNRYFEELRDRINVRVLALLSAARAFHDQRDSIIKKTFGKLAQERSRAIFSGQFDASISYRLSEALRNIAQHSSLPIVGFSLNRGSKWQNERDKEASNSVGLVSVFLTVSLKDLVERKKYIRSATLKELSDIGKSRIDIRMVLRNYASRMSTGMESLRDFLEPREKRVSALFESALKKHRDAGLDDEHAEELLHLVTEGLPSQEKLWIGSGLLRKLEERKRASLRWINKVHVTGEIIEISDCYLPEAEGLWIR